MDVYNSRPNWQEVTSTNQELPFNILAASKQGCIFIASATMSQPCNLAQVAGKYWWCKMIQTYVLAWIYKLCNYAITSNAWGMHNIISGYKIPASVIDEVELSSRTENNLTEW